MDRKLPDRMLITNDIKKSSNFKPRFICKNLTIKPVEFLFTITEMQLF